MIREITSANNPVYKQLKAIKRSKDSNNLLLIEGRRSVEDAMLNGADIRYLVFRNGSVQFEDQCAYSLSNKLFDDLCETQNPQDVLCVAKFTPMRELLFKNGVYIVCDRLQDPGNIGTIIRTAHAVSAAGVVLLKGCASIYNPKLVRATMGSIFSVDIFEFNTPEQFIAECRRKNIKLIAAAPHIAAVSLFDYGFPQCAAVLIGNEGNGLSTLLLDECDDVVYIPMPGGIQSLNAAVAAALFSYEYVRKSKEDVWRRI